MNSIINIRSSNAFSLLECIIAMFVFSFAILAIVKWQAFSIKEFKYLQYQQIALVMVNSLQRQLADENKQKTKSSQVFQHFITQVNQNYPNWQITIERGAVIEKFYKKYLVHFIFSNKQQMTIAVYE